VMSSQRDTGMVAVFLFHWPSTADEGFPPGQGDGLSPVELPRTGKVSARRGREHPNAAERKKAVKPPARKVNRSRDGLNGCRARWAMGENRKPRHGSMAPRAASGPCLFSCRGLDPFSRSWASNLHCHCGQAPHSAMGPFGFARQGSADSSRFHVKRRSRTYLSFLPVLIVFSGRSVLAKEAVFSTGAFVTVGRGSGPVPGAFGERGSSATFTVPIGHHHDPLT